MKISELARQLKVSRRTIYNMIADGRIKARKNFDGTLYISKAEAERLLRDKNGTAEHLIIPIKTEAE